MVESILLVTAADPYAESGGGIETHLQEMISRLSDDYEVHLLTHEISNTDDVVPHTFTNYPVRGLDTISYSIKMTIAALQALRKEDIDLVWTTDILPSTISAGLPSKLFSTPVLLSQHNILDETRGYGSLKYFINYIGFRISESVHVVGKHIEEEIEKLSLNIETHFIPNGINLEKFEQKSDYSRSQNLELICISHYRPPQKRQDILVDAVKDLEDVKLTLVGSNLEELDAQYENIEVAGLVPQEEIVPRLQSSDIFVLPSAYEGQGIAVIEAMSTGLPIIGTKIPSLDGVVDEDNGKLVELDADRLQEAIQKAKSWDLEEKGNKSRQKAEEYSWDKIYSRFKRLLEENYL